MTHLRMTVKRIFLCVLALMAVPLTSSGAMLITGSLAAPSAPVFENSGQPSGGALPPMPHAAGDFFYMHLQWDNCFDVDTSDPLVTVFPNCGHIFLEIWASDGSGASGYLIGLTGVGSYSSLDPAEPLDFDGIPSGPAFGLFEPVIVGADFTDPNLSFAGDRPPTDSEVVLAPFEPGTVRIQFSDGVERFEFDSPYDLIVPEPTGGLAVGLISLVTLSRRKRQRK